jgi:hypothetical protein
MWAVVWFCRAVNQLELAVDAPRKQRRVLVVGLHDHTVALELAKVLGHGERHAGSLPC